jgi:hypothetical protein
VHILWVIIIGFVAGFIARLLAPGPNNPAGFILTTLRASPARASPLSSARRSAGTAPIKAPE